MKVGDLVRRLPNDHPKYHGFKGSPFNSLAIIVGFDFDGDLLLRYANPSKVWENDHDNDYKTAWELVNATD